MPVDRTVDGPGKTMDDGVGAQASVGQTQPPDAQGNEGDSRSRTAWDADAANSPEAGGDADAADSTDTDSDAAAAESIDADSDADAPHSTDADVDADAPGSDVSPVEEEVGPPDADAGPPHCGWSGTIANADAASATYNDFTQAANWRGFNIANLSGTGGFAANLDAPAFDGRYVHFAPNTGGTIVRYDTKGDFGTRLNWELSPSTDSLTTLTHESFSNAIFDGRYVYFIPYFGHVVRFDSCSPSFSNPSAWASFNTATLPGSPKAFIGATFDGQYLYLAACGGGGRVTRYNTKSAGDFSKGDGWEDFDQVTMLDPNAGAFQGAIFDGTRVSFAPARYDGNAPALCFETTKDSKSVASWSKFRTATLGLPAQGFLAGAYDGQYVYFVPDAYEHRDSGPAFDGVVARYDSKAGCLLGFSDPANWTTVDIKTFNPDARGYAGAAFDGRYLYLIPEGNVDLSGRLLPPPIARYETSKAFAAKEAWTFFDTSSVTVLDGGAPTHFIGGAFDGHYLYLSPDRGGGVAARLDVKTPASIPNLPGFFGAFF